jgi:hypothetical protein
VVKRSAEPEKVVDEAEDGDDSDKEDELVAGDEDEVCGFAGSQPEIPSQVCAVLFGRGSSG